MAQTQSQNTYIPSVLDQLSAGSSKGPTFSIDPQVVELLDQQPVKESVRTSIGNTSESPKVTFNNTIDFDVSNLIDQCNRHAQPVTLQTRLDVTIFPAALHIWRQLRNYQGRKITLELRIAYHEKLIATEHFPDWVVNFYPPVSLLNTQRAIEATVGFRKKSADETLTLMNDLMREESQHLTHEINVVLNSLRMHYEHDDASTYDIKEALDSLNIFMRCTKENELSELNKKYTSVHTAPLASLWSGLPEGTTLPPGAIRVYRQDRSQDFRYTERPTR